MSKRTLVPVNLLSLPTNPVAQFVGDTYFNSYTRSIYIWDGVTWLEWIPASVLDFIDGGNEADGTDYVLEVYDLGNEAGGTDVYVRTYDAGGI